MTNLEAARVKIEVSMHELAVERALMAGIPHTVIFKILPPSRHCWYKLPEINWDN